MISCKKSKADIEGCTKLFLMLGLVLALFIAYFLIELKTRPVDQDQAVWQATPVMIDEEFIPETPKEPELPKDQQPAPPPPVLEHIEVVADDRVIEETEVASTETNLTDAVVIQKIDYSKVQEETVEEEIVEDVPFFIIEKVPVYPGCTGNSDDLRKCMEKKVQAFVTDHFNADLAQDLGLEPGVKRIFVSFVIDKHGRVTNIQSRAPHKALKKEAERVIKALPQMQPGEQRGRPVGVKYSLPIVFQVM